MLLGILMLSMFSSSIPSVKAGTSVTLGVDPSLIEYQTPAFGEVFTINLTILNVIDLYGFEFKLCYDTKLLDGVEVIEGPLLRGSGNTFAARLDVDDAIGQVWVAIALLAPAPPVSGDGTLASITFKIAYDPAYPENVTSTLDLADTALSDQEFQPIPHTAINGEYWCYSTLPKLEVQSYKATELSEVFDVNVTISGVAKLYGYEFTLSYNTTMLEAIEITIRPFLHRPTWLYTKQMLPEEGIVRVRIRSYGMQGASDTPSANGSGVLATITFRSICALPDVPTRLDLLYSKLTTKEGIEITHEVVDGYYELDPLQGDVNGDGKVNLIDLRAVANAFGSKLGDAEWIQSADINRDDIINIFDLVAVAINLGKSD